MGSPGPPPDAPPLNLLGDILRKSRLSSIAALGIAAVIGLAAAGSASAVNWGPISSVYNGSTVVSGRGTFTNAGIANAVTSLTITDSKNDGNNVYGNVAFYLWDRPPAGTTWDWQWMAGKSTPEFANTTQTHSLSFELRATATKARGNVSVCAQMGFPVPNSCTSAYPTFNY